MPGRIQQTGYSRVFAIPYRAGPTNQPIYEGFWKAEGLSWKQGDIKPIRYPSPTSYDKFITAGKIRGETGLPEIKIMAKFTDDVSDFLKLTRQGCDVDIQVHFGLCANPQDFNGGWTKVAVLEGAAITDYSLGNMGALEPSERAQIDESVPLTGEDYYEILRMIYSELASTQVVQEVLDIKVCDAVQCGLCGIVSDGCQYLFALTAAHQGSPGRNAELLISQNGGVSWAVSYITSIPATSDPVQLNCVGVNVVVTSQEGANLSYAPIADLWAGTETWTSVTTGIVASSEPGAMFTLGPTLTWLVGKLGYIYFTADPTAGVSVQDAGVATAQNLSAIHGWDSDNLVAVGASNAVVFTNDGGVTWASVTGPNVGVVLNTVFMRGQLEWWVGDAAGKVWYTINGGQSWTQKLVPKTGLGQVRHIIFSTPSVGYISIDNGTAGFLLRTIDGGWDWFTTPETSLHASLPTNSKLNKVATCADPNITFAAGNKIAAGDGVIIKGAATNKTG